MINLKVTVFIFVFFVFMKWHVRNFNRLRFSKYYNVLKYHNNYTENQDFSAFMMMLENIDIDRIRYKEKKELLRVLEYIFENYRLYKVKSTYLSWFTFINKYCDFYISEREYIVLEYILKLKEQLWGYYMKHYNIYYNIALNYIENCKRYLTFHKVLKDDKVKALENTDPRFYNFPWECILNERLSINKEYYKNLVK